MGRRELLADLGSAVAPESGRSVLVVFGFAGLKDYLKTMSATEGDDLLSRLSERLAMSVSGSGKLYEPRRGEFCALFEGELKPGWTMIPSSLDDEMWAIGVRTSFAIVVLPLEASTPSLALRRGNERVRAQSGELRPQRR
jgi:hypothetical protein